MKMTSFKIQKDINKIDNFCLYYQALCAFYKKNFYHAKLCIEILIEKKAEKPIHYHILSYIYARHNEKENAITTWCKSLSKFKNDRISKKALDYIKTQGRDLNLSEDDFFDKLVPKEPVIIPFNFIFKLLIILLVFTGLSLVIFYNKDFIIKKFNLHLKNRDDINKVYLPDYNPNLLSKPKELTEKYSYSEKEIKDLFELIKKQIIEEKIVEAQININKIKLSNASLAVKAKIDVLNSFITEPDYALFKNVISFKDFIKEKIIYNNIYILWQGRIVNKSIYKDKITFDIVIGDEKSGTIDGIMPVIFKKAIIINNNENVKVFGKIIIDDNKVYIDGKYIIKVKN